MRGKGVNFRRGPGNVDNGGTLHVQGRFATGNGQGGNEGINAPPVVRTKAIDHLEDAGTDITLVFTRTQDQVIEQFGRERFHIVFIDQVINELEGPLTNGNVGVLETFHHGRPVTLQGRHGVIGLGAVRDHDVVVPPGLFLLHNTPGQGIECDVANVIVAIQEESSQYVDGEDTETVFTLDAHDGLHALVENGVAGILGRFGVGGDLCEDVVHFFRGPDVVGPQQAQEGQDLYLQKGIGNAGDFVLGRVSRSQHVAEHAYQGGYDLEKGIATGRVPRVVAFFFGGPVVNHEDLRHELYDRDEDAV